MSGGVGYVQRNKRWARQYLAAGLLDLQRSSYWINAPPYGRSQEYRCRATANLEMSAYLEKHVHVGCRGELGIFVYF